MRSGLKAYDRTSVRRIIHPSLKSVQQGRKTIPLDEQQRQMCKQTNRTYFKFTYVTSGKSVRPSVSYLAFTKFSSHSFWQVFPVAPSLGSFNSHPSFGRIFSITKGAGVTPTLSDEWRATLEKDGYRKVDSGNRQVLQHYEKWFDPLWSSTVNELSWKNWKFGLREGHVPDRVTLSLCHMLRHARAVSCAFFFFWQGKMYALQAVLTPNALDIIFKKGLKVSDAHSL